LALLATIALGPAPAWAVETAFRLSDLDIRDPHFYAVVPIFGCTDLTDLALGGAGINPNLQAAITTDGDGDGLLDLSYLIVFNPLDQAALGGTLRFGEADCTAPLASTTCEPGPSPLQSITYQNGNVGTCLGEVPGTTVFPYSPPIATPSAPCFVTDPATVTLVLSGIGIPLRNSRIAATYVGNPATSLSNGLFLGFLRETDANATILPASLPVVGGMPLSSLLPGGASNCSSHNDKDTDGLDSGWWLYANFPAAVRPFTDPTSSVGDGTTLARLGPAYPNPFAGSLSLEYSIEVASAVRLAVHDAQGRRVAELWSGIQSPGRHSAVWNGRDASGRPAQAGVYFVRFEALGRVFSNRVVLLK
jgi:hypothetical protein